MVDVLLYLFRNYFHPNLGSDPQHLAVELTDAGFDPAEIVRAFLWLEGILHVNHAKSADSKHASIRHYNGEESRKLTLKSQGLLLSLEQAGILDQETRELVIDRAMALDVNEINVAGMKWVVFMVLLNRHRPAETTDETVEWLERTIFEPVEYVLH